LHAVQLQSCLCPSLHKQLFSDFVVDYRVVDWAIFLQNSGPAIQGTRDNPAICVWRVRFDPCQVSPDALFGNICKLAVRVFTFFFDRVPPVFKLCCRRFAWFVELAFAHVDLGEMTVTPWLTICKPGKPERVVCVTCACISKPTIDVQAKSVDCDKLCVVLAFRDLENGLVIVLTCLLNETGRVSRFFRASGFVSSTKT